MNFEIPELPYSKDALAPHISARTLEIHYERHHKGYMKKLRQQIEGRAEAEGTLEDLIRTAEGDLFNNAAQVWNHTFYWRGMKPDGGGRPSPALAKRLSESFGSFELFKREFAQAANGEFGSGWAWLVVGANSKLGIMSSSDADNPIRNGLTPLLTLDVWEHAYYLDHQNDRASYVEGFLDHLIDWEFAATNLKEARSA